MSITYKIRKVGNGYVVVYVDKKGRPMSDSGPKTFATYEEAEAFAKGKTESVSSNAAGR